MSPSPAHASKPVLVARSLTAGYDRIPVLRDLDLDVHEGEVVALLGPNGAGKTTTLLAASGTLTPLGGTIELFGEPGGSIPSHALARRGLAHLPQDRGLFLQLTVAENLRLRRRRGREADFDGALDLFPALRPLVRRRAGLLSGGEQQMLALSCQLVSRPRLLLVDELSLGLAPVVVASILPVVRRIAVESGVGVLLVEQQVDAALAVADRAVVLSHGRRVHTGPAKELSERPELLKTAYLGTDPGREEREGSSVTIGARPQP